MDAGSAGSDEVPSPPRRSMFVQAFIDPDLWTRAGWVGVGYRTDDHEPPWLFLLFQNDRPAKEIFEHWMSRIGRVDRYDEIRMSIVEGDVPGKEPGYTVTVGSEPEHTARRLRDERGQDLDVSNAVVMSRIHRMNPVPGSPHLNRFKQAYKREKCFDLLPTTATPNGIEPHDTLSIRKQVIHFRTVASLNPNDVDSIVL